MDKAQKDDQQRRLFFSAKQQLDQRRIQGVVTKETAPLTLTLLKEIRNLQQQLERKNSDSTFQHSHTASEEALTVQLRLLTLENNNLRMQILTMTDQMECNKQKLQAMCEQRLTSRIKQQTNQARLFQICKDREEQLRQALTQTTYKYNQLMDLIHENPSKARDYIKRLLKHKNITAEVSAINRQHYGTWQDGQNRVANSVRRELEGKLSLLESQLLSRNKQIQRLQNLVVDQCNMIAGRKWQNSQQQKMILMLEDQINTLRMQNEQLKKASSVNFISIPRDEMTVRSRSRSEKNQLNVQYIRSRQAKTRTRLKENQGNNTITSKQKEKKRQVEINRQTEQYLSPKANIKKRISTKQRQEPANTQKRSDSKHISQDYFPGNKTKPGIKQIKPPSKEVQINSQKGTHQNCLQNKKLKQLIKQEAFNNVQQKIEQGMTNTQRGSANRAKNVRSQSIKIAYKSPSHKLSQNRAGQNQTHLLKRKDKAITQQVVEVKSQSININYDRKDNLSGLQQQVVKLNKEMDQINRQKNILKQQLKEQKEKQINSKGQFYKKNQSPKLSEKREPRQISPSRNGQESATRQKMKTLRQQLYTTNAQKVSLQEQLNYALLRIRQLEITVQEAHKTELMRQTERIQNKSSEVGSFDDELYELRREVKKLKNQLMIMIGEKQSLTMRLKEIQRSLGLQSRQMRRFQSSLDKKYRDLSPSP